MALLICLGLQWMLFAKRVLRSNRNIRLHQKLHRWCGVTATLLFAAHAVRMGHLWMSGLSIVFFLVALTGVLNREVLGYRSNLLYLIWLGSHIALSATLCPLIAGAYLGGAGLSVRPARRRASVAVCVTPSGGFDPLQLLQLTPPFLFQRAAPFLEPLNCAIETERFDR